MIELLFNADSTPWFSAETGNLVGALGGAGIGIIGGTLGAVAGTLAPKGKGRNLVLRGMMTMAALGLIALAFGVVALADAQPYHVWYPMVMMGALCRAVRRIDPFNSQTLPRSRSAPTRCRRASSFLNAERFSGMV